MRTTDNNCGKEISNGELADLLPYSGVTLKKICEEKHPNLLVFPHSLGENGDDIGSSCIFRINDNKLYTNNVVGFVGIGNTKLSISSRFSEDDDKDFFLHYMLQRVLGINVVDLKMHSDEERIFDFLVYLFPYMLTKALEQGLYREYCTREYNDARVRGTIDIARHIKTNIPFQGNIAYRVREYSHDNALTQLIRHTIEYIKRSAAKLILHNSRETEEAVKRIEQATTSFNSRDLQKIIAKNMKPISRPYFSNYVALQRLCLMILCHKKLSFGNNTQQIYGILFDAAWLWEEYLAKLFKDLGFKHPKNKDRKGGLSVFNKTSSSDFNAYRYPDYWKNDTALDAKYKQMQSDKGNTIIDREDLNQIITYMYIRKFESGGFIHPAKDTTVNGCGTLEGYGGNVKVYSLCIPQNCNTFTNFTERIKIEEDKLKKIMQ
ncbi:McrC family protein [Prevotella sp. HUN102]|uniref:McrC family protein n=1 Tax=Prevotella sp. HUN102 TaxID=1392486 RepID=UPI0004904A28|nr:hypothetical protein [Prevotella sp. HUN102]